MPSGAAQRVSGTFTLNPHTGEFMNMTTQNDRVTLYYRQGSSDKVYQAAIEPKGNGFIVTFAYGRRGGTLNTGTKTDKPVDYAAAKKIYDKLVGEKTAKGYTPGEDGTPYQQTDRRERSTGVVPQLLNPIDEDRVESLVTDDAWCLQEKYDGRRILVRKTGQDIIGINRLGLIVGLPAVIVAAVQELEVRSCLLDGEAVGNVYHAFDLLEEQGRDRRTSPYSNRLAEVSMLIDDTPENALLCADTAYGTAQKRNMLDRLRKDGKEGAVFKNGTAPYTPGRPASGGSQLKLKFTATASCIVADRNGRKRSVALELIEGGRRIGVGNVTIPANHEIPGKGSVVEVRYLYAYPGGSLYQPVYLGPRDDIAMSDCIIGQLKFKTGEQEPE
jgi:bifunctional non-homologous end joining protein LigD